MNNLHPDFDDALLGRDAPLFFGLNTGWVETDLKRAYTTLIRRWKPEKFPEEFKRLRAVYEALRSAGSAVSAAPAPDEKNQEPSGTIVESREGKTLTLSDEPFVPPVVRPASAILREETREEARRILEQRAPGSVPDVLALAYLRAPAEPVWPGVCLRTLADALIRANDDEDTSALVAAVERVLVAAPEDDFRATLDAFGPFEEFGAYFDITADLWIGFSKKDPEACLIRLERLLHFTKAGLSGRHSLFLLRFGIAGAFRLSLPWLHQQARHLGSLHGLDGAATPANGRLASHSPLGPCARHVGYEMDYFEALLKVREELESPTLAAHPMTVRYRTLIAAFLDDDPEACIAGWEAVAGTRLDTFTPWVTNPESAYKVMSRIRETLDPVLTLPRAPAVPKGGGLAKLAATALHFTTLALVAAFVIFAFILVCRLSVALTDSYMRRPEAMQIVSGLAMVAIPVAAIIGGCFAFKKSSAIHRLFFRARRLALAPLVAATRSGQLDLNEVRRFLNAGLMGTLAKHLHNDEALLYRIRVFQGTRA